MWGGCWPAEGGMQATSGNRQVPKELGLWVLCLSGFYFPTSPHDPPNPPCTCCHDAGSGSQAFSILNMVHLDCVGLCCPSFQGSHSCGNQDAGIRPHLVCPCRRLGCTSGSSWLKALDPDHHMAREIGNVCVLHVGMLKTERFSSVEPKKHTS